ncbi:MAG: translocation/assembly module TamB domain-containing protein [Burkholderiaceae bacterium]|nr:translocation/assembly module TamB domain-containing protein [Burkholderiaceae bacterium]
MLPFNLVFGSLRFVLLATLGLLLALGLWTATPGSLATALALAAQLRPGGMSLKTADVSGSLLAGGRIGSLNWAQDGLKVEARGAELLWNWRAMLDGQLQVTRFAVDHLRISDQRPPSPQAAAPTDLSLPLRLDIPFSIGELVWDGPPAAHLTALTGKYFFDSINHRIDNGSVQFSSGSYQFSGTVGARGELVTALSLGGTVLATVPGGSRTLTLVADAQLNGALAGNDAQLTLQAKIAPAGTASLPPQVPSPGTGRNTRPGPPSKAPAKGVPSASMRAVVSAQLQPWQPQPVVQAKATWESLDLALLWPGAPLTRLSGGATVEPVGKGGWMAQVRAENAEPGTWDQQHLPLQTLRATARSDGRQWLVESLKASGAGGEAEAQGKFVEASAAWVANVRFKGIDIARVDSRMAHNALDGKIDARQSREGIEFDVQILASKQAVAAPTGPLTQLAIQSLKAQGVWQAPVLRLTTLDVQSQDESLASKLSINVKTLATQGELLLKFPGGEGNLSGAISPNAGQGTIQLKLADAAAGTRWLARWPVLGPALKPYRAAGTADLTGSWQGGWNNQGQALRLQATLAVPELTAMASGTATTASWRFSDLRADLQGTLATLTLEARGQAANGSMRYNGQISASGGRTSDGGWQARVGTTRFEMQDSRVAGSWTLQLEQPLSAAWQPGTATQALSVSAGALALTGPQPGKVRLQWQTVTGSRDRAGALNWRSQGEIDEVPLAWLGSLVDNTGGNWNLGGDLMLGGQWDISMGSQLRLRASMARRSGDLRLQGEDESAVQLTSGLREARLDLSVDNEAVTANLVWDSTRGGRLDAVVGTQLTRENGQWSWTDNAPVNGQLTAKLPRIGGWSVLAPPGWRLRGTLDGKATLAGTRAAPQWSGQLQAEDLAVRSAVDGIDFSKGRLRASLEGQRVNIESFSIRGAGDAKGGGGELSASGFALWPPLDAAGGVKAVLMELDVKAQGLRLSTRSDLRLAVSGDLQAQLKDAQFVLRGTLTADQALFILPEDTTPRLGSDVVVRSRVAGATKRAALEVTPGQVKVMPDVSVTLDLGKDFRVRGHGLATRLEGRLVLNHVTRGTLAPRLFGQIRTIDGTYKAYGQQLAIEDGVLRFSGPFDNPALEIRAVRANSTQKVGVEITGTVLSPRVRLFSEPDMPDAEKLSWLLLGRGSSGSGSDAALLQQAALALLGTNGKSPTSDLTEAIGLDEVSVSGESSNSDGTTNAAALTLGKRLTKDFYIAYEQSLTGTMGSFSIFYDLTRRLTLRARTGEHASVDLIFTIRYD